MEVVTEALVICYLEGRVHEACVAQITETT